MSSKGRVSIPQIGVTSEVEAILGSQSLAADVRDQRNQLEFVSPEWLSETIRKLPPDPPAPPKTQGYNVYSTQKEHWLGWLNPTAGTGTYPRRTGDNVTAKTVYNRIGEPKMLWWLAAAAGVDQCLLDAAKGQVDINKPLSSQCAAFRKVVPWRVMADALYLIGQSGASNSPSQK